MTMEKKYDRMDGKMDGKAGAKTNLLSFLSAYVLVAAFLFALWH